MKKVPKISNRMQELAEENALVLVTGSHVAKVYEIKKGRILQEPTVDVPDPRYTDKEGSRYSMKQRRAGRGNIFGASSDYEHDVGQRTEFLHALKKEIKDISNTNNVDRIYLFSPGRIIKHVEESLPQNWQRKVHFRYQGNFANAAPTELLKKIKLVQSESKERRKRIKPEAQKILKKRTRHKTPRSVA